MTFRSHPAVRPAEERNALATRNLGLVRWCLRRLYHREAVRRFADDCLSAGFLALLRCAELWTEGGGARFSSYAVPAIRHRMLLAAYRRGPLLFSDLPADDDTPFDPPTPERPEPREVDRERVRRALGRIRARYAHVLYRRYFDGLKPVEVARELRVSRSRQGQIEAAALNKLQGELDRLDAQEGNRVLPS